MPKLEQASASSLLLMVPFHFDGRRGVENPSFRAIVQTNTELNRLAPNMIGYALFAQRTPQTDMPRRVTITAPSRIHLGMLSVNEHDGRRFGGAGVMLDDPSLRLSMTRSDSDAFNGPLSGRVGQFVENWRDATGIRERIQCEVSEAPPEHVGLGVGTQLGMSVAFALDHLFGREISIEQRASSVGRGLRSAVGAFGFHYGGLIVENGKRPEDMLGQFEAHVLLPKDWRVVLVRPSSQSGLAGTAEVKAFQKLSSGVSEGANELRSTLMEQLLPAARVGDFDAFAESLYRYGLGSGTMFASSQGGPFLDDRVGSFVDWCRANGVLGVGQSSWGPTVFCWFPTASAAEEFQNRLVDYPNLDDEVTVSSVAQTGAQAELDN